MGAHGCQIYDSAAGPQLLSYQGFCTVLTNGRSICFTHKHSHKFQFQVLGETDCVSVGEAECDGAGREGGLAGFVSHTGTGLIGLTTSNFMYCLVVSFVTPSFI